MLTSQTQPVSTTHSITVGYEYDLDGNRTALTDGNTHTTYTTYNSRGLPETITEPPPPPTTPPPTPPPPTATTPTATWSPRAARRRAGHQQLRPDGRPDRPVRHRRHRGHRGPDLHLRQRRAAADRRDQRRRDLRDPGYQPATSESFGWDDRGLLLSASGSAGTSVFTYNGSGQLASAADAAGTSSYSYDTAGRLATNADPASGTTGTYSYNNLDQVTQISYGTGKDTQAFGYDNLHRLTSDTITTRAAPRWPPSATATTPTTSHLDDHQRPGHRRRRDRDGDQHLRLRQGRPAHLLDRHAVRRVGHHQDLRVRQRRQPDQQQRRHLQLRRPQRADLRRATPTPTPPTAT